MAVIHEPDAYTHIFDNRNAVDEYFKLKQRLALTDKERFNLYKINPNTTINIPSSRILPEGITENSTLAELIEGLKFYKEQNSLQLKDLAIEVGLSKENLCRYLSGKKTKLVPLTQQKFLRVLKEK